MELIDTHAHLQLDNFNEKIKEVLAEASKNNVVKVIVPGIDLKSSKDGINLSKNWEMLHPAIGIHPHEAKTVDDAQMRQFRILLKKNIKEIIAIGECGLDYHYNNSPKKSQQRVLEYHFQLASEFNLPMIFHVRDAHDDFWPIFDNFKNIRGVLHSFTAGEKELDQAIKRSLFVAINGIMTFTKNEEQLNAAKLIPKEKLLLETDAPFLTPVPYRGKMCKPQHVRQTAKFIASLRGEQLDKLAKYSSANARTLFGI